MKFRVLKVYYYRVEKHEVQVLECRSASNIEVQGSWIQENWLTYKVSGNKIDGSKGILSY